VRDLAARARADLERRVDRLLRAEQARFDVLLDAVAPPPGSADELRAAVGALTAVRQVRW
jgi:hypothetical protein